MKLYNIYKNIILENTVHNYIMDAINNRYRVKFHYYDEDKKATGVRTVEVYALGRSKAGHEIIRGYQVFGDTSSKIPVWKTFRVDRISNWQQTGWKFDKPVSDYGGNIPKYNQNGDGSMIGTVYNAKF